MKKYVSLITSVALLCSSMSIGTVQALGSEPPQVEISQLTGSRPNGAEVMLDYNLYRDLGEKPMAWDSAYTHFSYVSKSWFGGYYKFSRVSGDNSYFFSPTDKIFDVQPNRNYLVSALVYCDFDRVNSEVNIGIRVDSDSGEKENINLIDGFHGLPSNTNGQWLRFETTVTTPPDAKQARFFGRWYGFSDPDEVFCIADMEVSELPKNALSPLGVGEGLVFGGSSGMYNMKIEQTATTSSAITVKTNGAEYVFNKSTDSITVKQRIGNPRTLAEIKLGKSLANLALHGNPTEKEVVLTTGEGGMSFGVQMDGMLLVSTHGEDVTATVTSKIGGKWNRLLYGNLYSADDTGGFTVNPAIPLGTGRLARYTVINGVDFEKNLGDTTFISSAQPGWSISWTISSGERLGVTAFPPREYDWENSFDSNVANVSFSRETSVWQSYKKSFNMKYGILWDAFQGAYGMSYGTSYRPKDETKFKSHIAAAKSAGVEPVEYMSMFFWDGTLDEYISEVQRHKDTYGITGVYTDGVPPLDWLKAYEGMRRLREIFPDGCIIAHTTGQSANGGAPLATPEIFIPAIDSYATFTLRGEMVSGSTKDWPYPRYVTSGYGKSNVYGLQKYDAWTIGEKTATDGESTKTEKINMSAAEQQLFQLLYNGRARYDGSYSKGYMEILAKAKAHWEVNGWSDEYYEDCYLPYVRRLVREEHAALVSGGTLTGYPMVSIVAENFASENAWTQNNSTAILENGCLKIENGKSSFGDFLPSYGKTEISFKLKISALSQGRIDITDMYGNTAISILQTGDILRYLNRKGGYAVFGGTSADSFVDVVISADPVAGKYDLSIGGTKMQQLPFAIRTAELSGIKFSNGGSTAVFVDDLFVNSGL